MNTNKKLSKKQMEIQWRKNKVLFDCLVQGLSSFTYTIQMAYFLNLTMSKLLWPSFPLTITFSKFKSFWSGVTATDKYGPCFQPSEILLGLQIEP